MSLTQPAQVPLEHQLREVPQSLRMLIETDTWSSHTPVGHLCHEAADEIERLRGGVQVTSLRTAGFFLRIENIRISLCEDPEKIALDRDGEGAEFSLREFADMLHQFISERLRAR